MVEINLLPWREKQKQYESKQLKNIVFAAIFWPLILNFLLHWFFNIRIESENAHVVLLQEEMHNLENLQHQLETKNNQDNASEEWLQRFNHYQSATSHLFYQLIKSPIKNVCFTAMSRVDNTITFLGFTRSATDLNKLLIKWNADGVFSDIKIINLHERAGNQVLHFHFIAKDKNGLSFNTMNKEKEPSNAV